MPFARSRCSPGALWTARIRAGSVIGVGAAIASCGGLAADDAEPEQSSPGVSAPAADRPIGPMRETCDDNPLLAGCSYASRADPSPSPVEPAEPAEPVAIPEEEPLYIAAARNILVSHCGACHHSVLSRDQASGSLNYIDDWEQLIRAGFIERCRPYASRVIEVMRTGEMPPPSSGLPRVPDAEIEFVAQAIELDCSDD